MLARGVFGVGAAVGVGVLAQQRVNTYRNLYNGKTSFAEATKQNAQGLFSFGVGFAPLPVRAGVAGANVAMTPSSDRSQAAVTEMAGTVSPVSLIPAAEVIDSVPQLKEALGKPILEYAHDKGYGHVQSVGQAVRAMVNEDLRGNKGLLSVLEMIATNHPSMSD